MKKYYVYGENYKQFDSMEETIACFLSMGGSMGIYKAIGINTENGSTDIIVSIRDNIKISHDYLYMGIELDKELWENTLNKIMSC